MSKNLGKTGNCRGKACENEHSLVKMKVCGYGSDENISERAKKCLNN